METADDWDVDMEMYENPGRYKKQESLLSAGQCPFYAESVNEILECYHFI